MLRGLGFGLPGAGTNAPSVGRTTATVRLGSKTLRHIQGQSQALTKTEATAAAMATPNQRTQSVVESLVVQAPLDASDPVVARCQCLRAKVAEAAAEAGLDPSMVPQGFVAQCVANEAEVFKAMVASGVKVDGCRAWYMRRTTWLIGGAAAAGLLAWRLMR